MLSDAVACFDDCAVQLLIKLRTHSEQSLSGLCLMCVVDCSVPPSMLMPAIAYISHGPSAQKPNNQQTDHPVCPQWFSEGAQAFSIDERIMQAMKRTYSATEIFTYLIYVVYNKMVYLCV